LNSKDAEIKREIEKLNPLKQAEILIIQRLKRIKKYESWKQCS